MFFFFCNTDVYISFGGELDVFPGKKDQKNHELVIYSDGTEEKVFLLDDKMSDKKYLDTKKKNFSVLFNNGFKDIEQLPVCYLSEKSEKDLYFQKNQQDKTEVNIFKYQQQQSDAKDSIQSNRFIVTICDQNNLLDLRKKFENTQFLFLTEDNYHVMQTIYKREYQQQNKRANHEQMIENFIGDYCDVSTNGYFVNKLQNSEKVFNSSVNSLISQKKLNFSAMFFQSSANETDSSSDQIKPKEFSQTMFFLEFNLYHHITSRGKTIFSSFFSNEYINELCLTSFHYFFNENWGFSLRSNFYELILSLVRIVKFKNKVELLQRAIRQLFFQFGITYYGPGFVLVLFFDPIDKRFVLWFQIVVKKLTNDQEIETGRVAPEYTKMKAPSSFSFEDENEINGFEKLGSLEEDISHLQEGEEDEMQASVS